MSFRKNIPHILILFFFFSVFLSCIEEKIPDFDKPVQVKWTPTWAAPILKTNLSLRELIGQNSSTKLLEDEDQFLTLVFTDTFESAEAQEMIKIDNQVFQDQFSFTQERVNYMNNNPGILVEETIRAEIDILNVQNIEIDSLINSDLLLNLFIQSSFEKEMDIEINLPTVAIGENRRAWKKNTSVSKVAPYSEKDNWNQAFIDMTKGSQGHSQIPIEINISFTTSMGDDFNTNQSLGFELGFTEIDFGIFYGYTGPIEIFNQRKDSVEIDLFRNQKMGQVRIEDPRIKIRTGNQFGIPIAVGLNNFEGLSELGQVSLQGIPNPLPIGISSNIGETAFDSFELNKTNSNLKDLINTNPKFLSYQAEGQLNPADKTIRNFVPSSAKIVGRVETYFPLYGSTTNFQIRKMAPFALNATENPEEVESLKLHISADNTFPTDFVLALIFYDSDGQAIDSVGLQDEYVIDAAQINNSGETTEAQETMFDIELQKNQSQNLASAKRVEFLVKFNTLKKDGNLLPVKIYSHQNIEIGLGIEAKVNATAK
ncbi:MAG: Uncharacterised protein [Bacteroidetes bacterium MED-G17]|nr:MAG: Uncharacterised protein [Bacteroidetes bacterium MED-G17]|tara:strand:+ start:14864 stop:16486 length:1623 start_codon:yes stop_codon:yes gene_type:complete